LCLTQHLQLHPNPREIGKTILQHFLMDLFEKKFLANSMSSLTQQQWQEILLTIEEAFPWILHTLGLKFSPKYTKCKRN
jgi:hypothetical protein